LKIEEGEAAINQAGEQGCNVAARRLPLIITEFRDARHYYHAKTQCKFQEGLALAQKMPLSIQKIRG